MKLAILDTDCNTFQIRPFQVQVHLEHAAAGALDWLGNPDCETEHV